jgi:hypothetical protein
MQETERTSAPDPQLHQQLLALASASRPTFPDHRNQNHERH